MLKSLNYCNDLGGSTFLILNLITTLIQWSQSRTPWCIALDWFITWKRLGNVTSTNLLWQVGPATISLMQHSSEGSTSSLRLCIIALKVAPHCAVKNCAHCSNKSWSFALSGGKATISSAASTDDDENMMTSPQRRSNKVILMDWWISMLTAMLPLYVCFINEAHSFIGYEKIEMELPHLIKRIITLLSRNVLYEAHLLKTLIACC